MVDLDEIAKKEKSVAMERECTGDNKNKGNNTHDCKMMAAKRTGREISKIYGSDRQLKIAASLKTGSCCITRNCLKQFNIHKTGLES